MPHLDGSQLLHVQHADGCALPLQLHFPKANVTTHVLEGKSLAQQAHIYFNATIIIQTHGAALGGWHSSLNTFCL